MTPGAPPAVLGRDRSRTITRAGWHRRRHVTGGRRTVVPSNWRHANHQLQPHFPVVTYPSPSEKRSRSSTQEVLGYVRSLPRSAARPRRSRGSLDATQRLAAALSSTEPSTRSGTPIVGPSGPRSPNLLRTMPFRDYVQERLAGMVAAPDGPTIRGPPSSLAWSATWSPKGPAVGQVMESRADLESPTRGLPG